MEMPLDREITRPMLGTDQEPTSITWKSSLRSPVSSPRGPSQTQRSRSRTRSSTAALQSSMRSRTPSPLNKSLNNSTSNLRKSQTGYEIYSISLCFLLFALLSLIDVLCVMRSNWVLSLFSWEYCRANSDRLTELFFIWYWHLRVG